MNVLFVTPNLNWPLSHGAAIRKWNILQGLLSVGPVDVVVCGGEDGVGDNLAYSRCNRVFFIGPEIYNESEEQKRSRESTAERVLGAICSKFPYAFIRGDMRTARSKFRDILGANQYSLVWVETLRCGIFLDVVNCVSAKHIVLDGDDFSWKRDFSVLRGTRWYGAKIFEYVDVLKMRYWEMQCAGKYSYVARCSREDAIRQGKKNVIVIENGTNVPNVVRRRVEARAIFVGLLSYEPNRIGVEWFISRVWPKIFRKCPEAIFDVVGMNPSQEIMAANGRDGIRVHGFVSDLGELYERAALSVVPLHAGGGTRLKILEAIGRAVPVVSTTIGAYGIPLSEFHGLIRRDGEGAFAAACVDILVQSQDEAQQAAESGRKAVIERFDWREVQKFVTEFARGLAV